MKKELQIALQSSVKQTEDGYIFIEPVCKFFGIQTRNQLDRLKADKICQSDMRKNSCQSLFGDQKPRVSVGKRGFIRWIQIINPAILRGDLRELFEEYQVAVFDYLYSGNEKRVAQLEDIRQYALNINEAIRVKRLVSEYIAEQKNHRDLCLGTPPDQWPDVKRNLTTGNTIPPEANMLRPQLPSNIGQLKLMKKNYQTNIGKHQHQLDYQRKTIQPEPNPMPEGYKREVHKLYIRNYENEIARIDMRLMELTGGKTLEDVSHE